MILVGISSSSGQVLFFQVSGTLTQCLLIADPSSGLLSLTVEFFRVNTSPCPTDNNGNPITSIKSFPYGNTTCGLTPCDVNLGPFSPLRQGSANNIYVIPAPQRLTVDTATLFAAGCCIPAILSLVSMWNKILEINWKDRFGNRNKEEETEKSSEDKYGADLKKMNDVIRFFLTAVEVPVFGAAVLAILIIGERNFWSQEVYYQTEPIKAIGMPPLQSDYPWPTHKFCRPMGTDRWNNPRYTGVSVH
jgi:hypothetical protein